MWSEVTREGQAPESNCGLEVGSKEALGIVSQGLPGPQLRLKEEGSRVSSGVE